MFTKITPKIRVKDFATASISEQAFRLLSSSELKRVRGGSDSSYTPKGSLQRRAD